LKASYSRTQNAALNEESSMDIEAIEKDAVVLIRYEIFLTQAHDGILLTLYGDDSAGNAREIATVIMHPNAAEEIANQLLHAQLRAQES
jgi:hypothetical protein